MLLAWQRLTDFCRNMYSIYILNLDGVTGIDSLLLNISVLILTTVLNGGVLRNCLRLQSLGSPKTTSADQCCCFRPKMAGTDTNLTMEIRLDHLDKNIDDMFLLFNAIIVSCE